MGKPSIPHWDENSQITGKRNFQKDKEDQTTQMEQGNEPLSSQIFTKLLFNEAAYTSGFNTKTMSEKFHSTIEDLLKSFAGREKELLDIKELVIYKESPKETILISGVEGIGKTAICQKLIQELAMTHPNFTTTWIESGHCQYLSDMMNSGCDISPQDIEKYNPKLFVLDNIFDKICGFDSFFNLLTQTQASIIITSRNENLDISSALKRTHLRLSPLSNEDSYMLIRDVLMQPDMDGNHHQLCKLFNNNPGGIKQALNNIKAQRRLYEKGDIYGISEFLSEFSEEYENVTENNDHSHVDMLIPSFTVPSVSEFAGRLDELKELNKYFDETPRNKSILIWGLPGIGKTELCCYWVMRKGMERKGRTIITFLDGSNISHSVIRICNKLHILTTSEKDGFPEPTYSLLPSIVDNMHIQPDSDSWLVVIDNIPKGCPELAKIHQFLLANGAFILLTSRSEEHLGLNGVIGFKIPPLKEISEEISCPLVQTEEIYKQICGLLEFNPMAIKLMSSYIKHFENFGATKTYLEELVKELEISGKNTKFSLHGYHYETVIALKITINHIISKDDEGIGGNLLEILSIINPNGIRVEFLLKFVNLLLPTEVSLQVIKDLCQQFAKFGLFSFNFDNYIILPHLIQEMLRLFMDWEVIVDDLLEIEINLLPREELFHIISIWDHVTHHPELVRGNTKSALQIFHRLDELLLIREQTTFAGKNFDVFLETLGENNMQTVRMKHNLARSLQKNGKYDKALTLAVEVLQKLHEFTEGENEDAFATSNLIASILWKQERFEDSIKISEATLVAEEKKLSNGHQLIISTKYNLTLAKHSVEKWNAAVASSIMKTTDKEAEELALDFIMQFVNTFSASFLSIYDPDHERMWTNVDQSSVSFPFLKKSESFREDWIPPKRVLASILIEGVATILQCFRCQLLKIWRADKLLQTQNLEKVASTAISRCISYIKENEDTLLRSQLSAGSIFNGIITGSESQTNQTGETDAEFEINGIIWNPSEMFETTAIIIQGREEVAENAVYVKPTEAKFTQTKYGCRLLSHFEYGTKYFKISTVKTPVYSYLQDEQLQKVKALVYDSIRKSEKEGESTIFDKLISDLQMKLPAFTLPPMDLVPVQLHKRGELMPLKIMKPDETYVERTNITEDALAKLTSKMEGLRIVNLYGMGGHGKTQIARHIVHEVGPKHGFDYFIWINATNEYLMKQDFKKLLNLVTPEALNIKIPVTLDQFYTRMKNEHLLVVFDNVQNFKMIGKYLPLNEASNTSVLLTSREVQIDKNTKFSIKNIEIPEFQQDEVKLFIKMRSRESAHCIVAEPESIRVPLLLSLIFPRNNLKMDYYDKYPKQGMKEFIPMEPIILDALEDKNSNNYIPNLIQITNGIMRHIRKAHYIGDLAQTILNYLAYTQPSIPITVKDLAHISPVYSKLRYTQSDERKQWDEHELLGEAVHMLVAFGLVQISGPSWDPSSKISMEESIQSAIRMALKASKYEEKILRELCYMMKNTDGALLTVTKLNKIYQLLRITNAISLWPHLANYPDLVKRSYPREGSFIELAYLEEVETIKKMINCLGVEESIQNILGEIHYRFCPECPNAADIPTHEGDNVNIVCELIKRYKKEKCCAYLPGYFANGAILENNSVLLKILKTLRDIVTTHLQDNKQLLSSTCATAHNGDKPLNNVFLQTAANKAGVQTGHYILQDAVKNNDFLVFCLQNSTNFDTILKKLPHFHISNTDSWNRSILSIIMEEDKYNLSLIQMLLGMGARPQYRNQNGWNALHQATLKGDIAVVNAICTSETTMLDDYTNNGERPIHIATKNGRLEMVEYLLKKGAKMNEEDHDGQTALMWAVKCQHMEIIRTLLHHGADHTLKTRSDDYTAIHYAVMTHYSVKSSLTLEIIDLLVKEGVDVKTMTKNGDTILHLLIRDPPFPSDPNISMEVASHLMEVCAGLVGMENKEGVTPIQLAEKIKSPLLKVMRTP